MDSDITVNSVALVKNYDNETGSRRSSIARGVNTPDVMTIQHQDAVDSSTKVANRRHVVRLDSYESDSETSTKFRNSAYVVLEISSLATQAQIDSLLATFRAVVARTTAGSNIMAATLNNES